MHITGRHHRLVKLLAQFHHTPVDVPDVFHGVNVRQTVRFDHELIVAKRLDLQIIVKIYQPCDLCLCRSLQQGTVQFSGFTGAAH